jgi:hypothetical protein
MVSVPPPGENGAMMWIGLSGYPAAASGTPNANKINPKANDKDTRTDNGFKRDVFIRLPLLLFRFRIILVGGRQHRYAPSARIKKRLETTDGLFTEKKLL